MRLAARIRSADPLRGRLPDELIAPALPPGEAEAQAGRRRARVRPRALVIGLAAICVVAAVAFAVRPQSSETRAQTFAAFSPSGGRATPAQVARTVAVLRARLVSLRVTGARVDAGPGGSVRIRCAGCAARRVAAPGRLLVYDWEANVLGPRCRPAPSDDRVTGGASAGAPGAATISHYDAVLRAARCPARHHRLSSHAAAVYYLVNPSARRVLRGPEPSRRAAATDAAPPGARIVAVPPGAVVVRAQDAPDEWYVLRDDATVSGRDVVNAGTGVDQAGGRRAPIVTFELNPRGRRAWRALTRRVARRGQAHLGLHAAPQAGFQHFAVALDDRLLAVPFVDPHQNPDGIDPRDGVQIEGGFTEASARELVALLRSGALPARLAPAGP